jgi:predicted amidophosphoribosyltransferase
MVKMIPFDVIPCDVLVPIPLHWTRYACRGYNQATEMAKVIRQTVKAPVTPVLVRHKRTVFQSRLTGAERQDNVGDAFGVAWRYRNADTSSFKGKHIVLVDDLYTTGATVKSAARVLLTFQPKSITAVVACRAL